jgi:nicotinamidase-related amidase
MSDSDNDPHGHVPDRAATVLLILDLISDFSFEGGAQVARGALKIARRIARLKRRARSARVPVVYVNDALGRWRSDFPGMVRHCRSERGRGRFVVETIAPEPKDYCILKPKHSGFFATPLDIPRDCISARTPQDTRLALRYFATVLKADLSPSTRLRLRGGSARKRK